MNAGGSAPASSCGPVAQLGARLNGIEEVEGSNPSRSTKLSIEKSPAIVSRGSFFAEG